MARPIKVITAGAEIRAELQRRANAPTSAHRDRFRAKIILLRLEGLKIATVAKRLKTSMPTVSTWSARFEAHGLDGLNDKSGRGRKPSITEKKIERVVTDATRPPKNRKRWSVRSMGRHAGVSHSTVQRIWSKNGLKPHVVKKFKLSNDPEFEKKFWDVIGLYLDPPAKGVGVMLRREEPMPGSGAYSTRSAACAQASPDDDARLHPAWHDHVVCGTRCDERQVDRAH